MAKKAKSEADSPSDNQPPVNTQEPSPSLDAGTTVAEETLAIENISEAVAKPSGEATRIEVIDAAAGSGSLNIHQRVLKITEDMNAIEKTGRNDLQKYNFIEQAAVVAELRPRMARWGVIVIQSVKEHEIIKKEKGSKVVVTYNFDVINADKPEDRFSCEWVGEGDDSLDKGTNKAATAAEKYFLMKLFKISDKNDPDAEAGMEKGPAKAAEPPLPYNLARRPANALMNDQERKVLFKVMLNAGFEGDDQLELLSANGIKNPKEITHGVVLSLINKLTTGAFAKPQKQKDAVANVPDDIDLSADFDKAVNEMNAQPPVQAPQPEPTQPVIEEPQLVIDDEFKSHAKEVFDTFSLTPRGVMWFKQKVTGRPFGEFENFTDEQWRKAWSMIEGILDLRIEVPEEYVNGYVSPNAEGDQTTAAPIDPSEPKSRQTDQINDEIEVA